MIKALPKNVKSQIQGGIYSVKKFLRLFYSEISLLLTRVQRVPATRIELGFFCTTRTRAVEVPKKKADKKAPATGAAGAF